METRSDIENLPRERYGAKLRCGYRQKRCSNARDGLERSPTHERTERPASGVRLLCKVHNALRGERDFGKEVMDQYRRSDGRVSVPLSDTEFGALKRALEAEHRGSVRATRRCVSDR